MELSDLAADGRDADCVLEEPARVAVVSLGGGGEGSQPGSQLVVVNKPSDSSLQAGMRDLRREELEKPLELIGIAAHRRREGLGIGPLCGLESSHLELKAVAKPIDAAENTHRVTFGGPAGEEIYVTPHARLHAAAGIDELECEGGSAASRPQPLLLCDRVHALDDAVLLKLGDRGHPSSLGPETDATVAPPCRR